MDIKKLKVITSYQYEAYRNAFPNIKEAKEFEEEANRRRKARTDKGKQRQKYASNLPPKYKSYLMRANKKGIKFEFTIPDFELMLKQYCVYCGSGSKIGIDRIDSGSGYTLENCVPCCYTCNMMKYTFSQEQFTNQIKKIHKHLNLDNQTKLIL